MVLDLVDDGKSSKDLDGRCERTALLVWLILWLRYCNSVVITSVL